MESILGQPHAIHTLQSALDSGKVHHAWVFHGPPGVGKFTAAVEFARIVLDPGASRDLAGHVRADPDGRTSQLIDTNAHPDLHVIRKELALDSSVPDTRRKKLTNIPLDVLREFMIGGVVKERVFEPLVYHSPRFGHGKVFIIEEAELLAWQAQNALLKSLEEPPRGTYIVLVTTQPDKLLPTIRSRCQRVAFTPLDEASMAEWFRRADLDVSGEERAWIERFAAGSPGLATLAAEDGLYQWHVTLAPMIRQVESGEFPPGLGERFASLVDDFATEWVKQRTNASKEAANRAAARRLFMLLASHALGGLHADAKRGEDTGRRLAVIDAIREAETAIDRNVNLKLTLDNLAAQWADINSAAGAVRA